VLCFCHFLAILDAIDVMFSVMFSSFSSKTSVLQLMDKRAQRGQIWQCRRTATHLMNDPIMLAGALFMLSLTTHFSQASF